MTRIAFFHNRYRTRGGEDRVVDLEMDLLRKAGHEVHAFLVDSRDLRGPADTLRAGWESNWSHAMGRRVARFLDAHPVDVGHVHNFFPLLTPVVQTLHNYRLVCANGLFLREGRPCEECVARGPWNAVRHGCYRGSRLQTAAWARAATRQRARGLWRTLVDRFVAPSDFLRRKLVAAGLPDERFVVKPNPVPDPGPPAAVGQGAVYVGRLSPEKGVRLLLEAWRELEGESLTVVGTGAEESELRRIGRDLPGVRFTGELAPDRVQEELARAAFLVAPSLCYENFPLAVAEAFAAGRPVVASHPSALSDLVEDGRTGLRFATGSAAELASACRRLAGSPALCAELGREARQRYEDELTPERCAAHLEEIYGALLR